MASWGRSGAEGEKLGDVGLVGVVGDFGLSALPFLRRKAIKQSVKFLNWWVATPKVDRGAALIGSRLSGQFPFLKNN